MANEDSRPTPPRPPEVGQELVLPVLEAPTRTTLFPEQVIVAGSSNSIDLIMLRTEARITAQRVKVIQIAGDSFEGAPVANVVTPQLVDIGHVRMSPKLALEAGLSIIANLIEGGVVTIEEVALQLTQNVKTTKSPQ